MVSFKELGFSNGKAYLSAYARRPLSNYNQSGIPLIIEISETKVEVNIVKSQILGSNPNSVVPVLG